MAQCKNCGKKLGCSCKRRTASNGASCCATCLKGLEAKLGNKKKIPSGNTAPGVILNTSAVQID